jgi:hypothetical protein
VRSRGGAAEGAAAGEGGGNAGGRGASGGGGHRKSVEKVLARRFISLRQLDRFRGLLGFAAPTLLSAFRFPTHEWISTERAERSLAAKSPAEIRCEKNLSEIFFPYAHLV